MIITRRTALVAVCASALCATAAAAETPPPRDDESAAEEPFGSRARRWLELQESGRAAAPARGQDAAAVARARERYLASFNHPIPESFVDRKMSRRKR